MARAVLVERQRLIGAVARASPVVVGAPSGFGKTVLADHLLRRWNRPVLRWSPSTLVERAVEPAELVDGLRRNARRAGFVDMASTMLATSPSAAVESFLDHVVHAELELSVAFDDLQLLDDDALELVARIADSLPSTCRFVACHRPDRRLGQLAALARAATIDERDLAMRADEIGDLVQQIRGVEPDATLVDDLLRATLGWPVAVNLAAIRLRDDPTWHPGARSSGARLLGGLVLPFVEADPAAAARVATPPLLDPAIVDLLAGAGAWSRWETDGPPLTAMSGWWILPDAIRDAVAAAAAGRGRLSDPELRGIGSRYVDRGELGAAVDLFASVQRPDLLVAVLARCHWSDLEASGAERLVHWYDLAEGSGRAEANELASFGITLVHALEFDHPATRDRMVDRLVALGDRSDLAPAIARSIRAEDLRRGVVPGAAPASLDAADAQLATTPPDEILTRARLHVAGGYAASMLSSADDKERAARHLRDAAALFGVLREYRWQAAALARLGYNVFFHGGRYREADAVMGEALSLLSSGDRARGFWLACHAEVHDHLGRRVDAIAAVQEAVAVGERLGDPNVRATALWTLGWIHGHRGDLAGLQEAIAAVESQNPAFLETFGALDFYGSMADHLVACGDVEGARRCLDRARAHPAAAVYVEAVRMAEARWEAVVGDPTTAIAILDELGGGVGTQRNADWVRLVERAVARARSGDHGRARDDVAAAFADCAALGVPDLPLRLERPLLEHLDRLLDGAVSALVGATSAESEAVAVGEGPGPAVPARPGASSLGERPADVSVLGRFSVGRGAVDVSPPDGLPAMLVKLVAVRGAVHAESLIEEFWPDVDVDTGRARLRNLLHRVRSRSGDLLVRRGSTITFALGVACDLPVFEAAVADVERADDHRRPALARRAASLYGGELLPDDRYVDWLVAPRERLRMRHLEMLDVVADTAERTGALDEAMDVLRRAVELDPLDDGRCVRAARLHLRQARPAVARALARRSVRALVDHGLPVSDDLRALAGTGDDDQM